MAERTDDGDTGADLLATGTAALTSGDWMLARRSFEEALDERESAEAHDGLSEALYWLNELTGALRHRERAYIEFRRSGDRCGAARAAMWLGQVYLLLDGNSAAFNGWMARAERLLDQAGRCVELGWLEIYRQAWSSNPATVEQAARKAIAIARQYDDVDLESVALAFLGLALVSSGKVPEGMISLDEAMAAATSGELKSFSAIGIIYCTLLTACRRVADLKRAEQWCRVMDDFIQRNHGTSFSATCRTFYGDVLAASGRWPEAEQVLLGALRTFDESYRAMRVDTLVALANLRIRQGRLDEAFQLLHGYEDHPQAAHPISILYLARGEPALAEATLQRRLRQLGFDATLESAPFLALLVDAQLAQLDIDGARATTDQLASMARSSDSAAIRGAAELATAQVSMAAGEDPVAHLEASFDHFGRAAMPLEQAHAQLLLAQTMAEHNSDLAASEASAALGTFQRLGAARDVDAAHHLLRQLGSQARVGPRSYDTLTRREQEVLGLLGLGFSNGQIADSLFISRRTAEHHVSSILSKLGLNTRAEAASYAVRHGVFKNSVAE